MLREKKRMLAGLKANVEEIMELGFKPNNGPTNKKT